jgi:hypothetical protein
VKVVIDEHYERLFTYIPKRKAPDIQPILTIENVDPVLKTAVLSIDTKLPLVDFWVYAKQRQLHFDVNFKSLLPGTHKLAFTYSGELPTTQELQYQVR